MFDTKKTIILADVSITIENLSHESREENVDFIVNHYVDRIAKGLIESGTPFSKIQIRKYYDD